MRVPKSCTFITAALLVLLVSTSLADRVISGEQKQNGKQIFWLSNDQIKCSIFFEESKLISDRIEAHPQWLSKFRTKHFVIETDADFNLEVMWTGWRAPGKVNNAENPIKLSKQNFKLMRHDVRELPGIGRELNLIFKGLDNSLELRITYQIEKQAFFAKRKVAVRDSELRQHFLQWIWPRYGQIFSKMSVLNSGGFGQPIALQSNKGGVFFGLEYPTSENSLVPIENGKTEVRCGQEIGELVKSSWVESEWAVEGLSPNPYVKLWFWKYLDHIRVASLRPYLLYNTWYDVRALEIVKSPEHVMNEENLLRIIESFRKEMVEKRGIKLDAFVLDDGWDIYRSNWVMRAEQFPRGLNPVKNALKEIGTDLGIWFGPIGGYSNRDWRVDWMHAYGYEVVRGQLCLAGDHYKKLFRKRVLDFVRNDSVGYYKWDGIQYSCSEPDHGHAVGIFSRRAVMETVVDLCRSVRAENPNIFLNITSGTWLSPWWVKYANVIWMQGYDYGYSNVPSISRRDMAITYRDYVLYEDFRKNNFWFPLANLMTHGIIKGHLQKLGGEEEPLDKFTDNAILYFARGVSMWELYISPDLLTEGEWNALAKSIRWAKDRFEILRSTEMIGGDPGERKAYGYIHFNGKRGILAVRNPFIEPQNLKVVLLPSLGLDPEVSSLVLERIYPTQWISPDLYKPGSNLNITLHGYETAVYEIYPVEETSVPLLAGVTYEVAQVNGSDYVMKVYDVGKKVRLLNPEKVRGLKYADEAIEPYKVSLLFKPQPTPVSCGSVKLSPGKKQSEVNIQFNLHKPAESAMLAVLLETVEKSTGTNEPEVNTFLDGEKVRAQVEKQEGRWGWYKLNVRPGKRTSRIIITSGQNDQKWEGKISVWLICVQKPESVDISFDLKQKLAIQKPIPPRPWPIGEMRKNIKLGEVEVY